MLLVDVLVEEGNVEDAMSDEEEEVFNIQEEQYVKNNLCAEL